MNVKSMDLWEACVVCEFCELQGHCGLCEPCRDFKTSEMS